MSAVTDRIERDGPIPFAEYMRLALYDPDEGFYARRVPGSGAGYRTSPSLSEWFGRLFARWATSVWEDLGKPEEFTVVEAGAGRADLAAQALEAFEGPLRWVIVEPFDQVAARQRERLAAWGDAVSWRRSPCDGPPVVGCVVANEVLDNQPVHLLEKAGVAAVEIYVGLKGGRLVEVPGPLSDPTLAALAAPALGDLDEGDRLEVSPAALDWVTRAARALERGTMLVVDYGDEEPDLWRRHPAGTLVTYREEGLGVDLLAAPGEADLTAHVNFSALTRAAVAAGLEPGPLLSQREWLESLGSAQAADDLRRRQEEAQFAGDHAGMVHLLAERSRLSALSARGGLGDLLVFSATKR
ncbi:MAG TPA: SAM-dependent methyltransferase [Actinomycetota bacterium]|jgi:SAM-dependent MidA family methyltransferase